MNLHYPRVAVYLLFFTSGFTSLVFETLWMKELGLLFGNTAQSAATTLAAFFFGLSAGSLYWGRKAERIQRPLRAYGLLEIGVAISAISYFFLRETYHALYPALVAAFGDVRPLFLSVKFLIGFSLLAPASFFMGGTYPMVAAHMIRRRDRLGTSASALYATNTLGAALGAYQAGFHLPRAFGFDHSYLLAMGILLLVAVAALILDKIEKPSQPSRVEVRMNRGGAPSQVSGLQPKTSCWLAFYTGFVVLNLEVLWTRMFSQVLHNSVYTYAVILTSFLLAIGIGGTVAHLLSRHGGNPRLILFFLLMVSGAGVGLSPHSFLHLTDGLDFLGDRENWSEYIQLVFGTAGVVLILPGILMGSVFPYLMKTAEPWETRIGSVVGNLAGINTLGAVAGSVTAGFLLLPHLGLWKSINLSAASYFVSALAMLRGGNSRFRSLIWLPLAGIVAIAGMQMLKELPIFKPAILGKYEETLVEAWEGSAGTVAVVETPYTRSILLNNHYTLGGKLGQGHQELMAHLPILAHPHPSSILFIGMGTGITAGGALLHPVEEVVVTEVIPEAITAAEKYFASMTNGLFEDPRVRIVAEDGRNYLMGSNRVYDLIIGDLFVPWKSGTGSLYTIEHFQAGLSRLREDGLFAQWIPLYQVSEKEFGIVAKTMLEVFPLVTLWRGDVFSERPIVMLLGHRSTQPVDPETVTGSLETWVGKREGNMSIARSFFFEHYIGNLSEARTLFEEYRINTDNIPLIEYEAPISQRGHSAGEIEWFVGPPMLRFFGRIQGVAPFESDPYLQNCGPREIDAAKSGYQRHLSELTE